MSGKSLNDVFKSFCAGKPEMESKQFSKLIKECKLTDKKFGINDIDIVFAKVKSGKVKTITFAEFEKAIEEIAKKKGTTKALNFISISSKAEREMREGKTIHFESAADAQKWMEEL